MGRLFGWKYRKSVTLSRASGAVNNHRMKLQVGESSGATGEDVDCGGKCLTTFNDLRFTTSDGTTLLKYSIKSISGTTPNQLATIWIKFDTIGTSDTTFYMYYGKADAPAVSSAADTFIFGDDFERGSNGDAVGGSWSSSIGSPVISTEQHDGGTRALKLLNSDAYATVNASADIAIQFSLYKPDSMGSVHHQHGNADHEASIFIGSDEKIYYVAHTIDTDSGSSINADAWNIIEFYNFDWTANTCSVSLNGIEILNAAATRFISWSENLIRFSSDDVSNPAYIDNVFVRDYLATEAVWGSWGAEEEDPSVTITPGPLFVTASLSGTPWPELQKVTPGPMAVTASLSITSATASFIVTPAALAAVASLSAGDILSFIDINYIITYVCYLTPSVASGLSELTIPMSSFQGRFKSGDPSFLSVVTPGFSQSSDITNRIGENDPPELAVYMVKTYKDGNQIAELIMAVDLEDVRIDQGAVNQSITLEGHRTNTYTAKSVTLTGASYKNLEDGSLRYRCSPDLYLRPGDTVTVNGETFTANNITIAMSVDSQTMEVSEAD